MDCPLSAKRLRDYGVRILLQSGNEGALVVVNPVKERVLEVPKVEEWLSPSTPWTDFLVLALVMAPFGDLHGAKTGVLDAHHDLELRRGLDVVGPAGWKHLLQKGVKAHDGGSCRR